MHEYLRSIGFSGTKTRKQLKELVDWVLQKPDHVSITSTPSGSNVAEASREVGGRAGVTVIGEVNEQGTIIPEYYFPYVSSSVISSDSVTSCDHESTREGYISMCADSRFNLSLICRVLNVVEVLRGLEELDTRFTRVCFSALAKDATVILSGECADEIFGGYPWYRDETIRAAEGFPWAQSTQYRASFLRPEYLAGVDPREFVLARCRRTEADAELLDGDSPVERRMRQMMRLNTDWFMATLLDRKDRCSMYSSLEVRVPFCDHRIAGDLYNVPWELKEVGLS